ncbi:uncharacterized protein [Anabrus simplex]|uniref:uncharacterized protein n=1 Tax=Anabrus simplex TaxID=316456 RepID=UPI0035A35FCB
MESAVPSSQTCHDVCWEDHFVNLVTTLKNFSLSSVLTDIIFITGKEKIAVHQAVLSGFTSYFNEFVKKGNVVLMEEIDHTVVQGIIDYIYMGAASVPRNDVIKLYRTAELLRMEGFSQFETYNDSAISHFTWPKHREVLLQCLWDSRREPDKCDVVFFTSDLSMIYSHSSLLASCSNFLLQIFEKHCERVRKPYTFVLQNVPAKILELVLEYCYKGQVKVIEEDIKSLHGAAKLLRVQKLYEGLEAIRPALADKYDKEKVFEYRSVIRTSSQCQSMLSNFLEHESLTDLLIFVDNQIFMAHSVILSAFSLYFRSLAKCMGQCMKDTFVLVKDVKRSHMQTFLDYIYKGEANFEGSVDDFRESMGDWLDFSVLPISEEYSSVEEKYLKEKSITSDNESDITSKVTECSKQEQQLLTFENGTAENWQNDPAVENSVEADATEEVEMRSEEKGVIVYAEGDLEIQAVNQSTKTSSSSTAQACYTCKELFPTRQLFREHLAVHPDGRTLRCKYCKKGFRKPSQMKLHLRTHTGERPFHCAKCGMSFAAKSALTKHLDTHLKDKGKIFVCDVCSKSFSRKEYLEEHIRTHTGSKPYVCPICQKTFVGRTGLNHHKKTHAAIDEKRSTVCEICGKSLTRHALWTHIKSHEKAHECEICHKFFATKTVLKIHVAGTHYGHRWHQCEICGKGFMQKYHLVRHMKVHENEIEGESDDPFACKKCARTFKTESKLDAHMRSEHSEPGYSCNICHKRFAGRSTVIYHRRAHTGERPHRCPACGKTFVRPDTLRQHVRSHTGERLFECTVCSKKCSTRSALNKHALSHKEQNDLFCAVCSKILSSKSELEEHSKIHSGSRSFRCNNCRKSFRYQDSLNKHLRIHSSGVVLPTTDELPCMYSFEVCRPTFEQVQDLNNTQSKTAGPSSFASETLVPPEDLTANGLQPYNIVSNNVRVTTEDKNPVGMNLLPRRPYSITIDGNLCCNNETLVPPDGSLVSSLALVPPHQEMTPLSASQMLHQQSSTTHTELNPVPVPMSPADQTGLMTPNTNVTFPSILSKAFSL